MTRIGPGDRRDSGRAGRGRRPRRTRRSRRVLAAGRAGRRARPAPGRGARTGRRGHLALGPLAPALRRLAEAVAAGVPAVVLASGDPGLFGIVRPLRAAGLPLRVVPAVSSVAAAFAARPALGRRRRGHRARARPANRP